uniref:Kazal-like domain-containing protein n=1 Tax=Glossina palpalis gambiensis TaxID=67801 RepID=A0A1B0BDX4_9MUSC
MEVGVATAATVALLLLLPLFTVVTLEAFGCAVAPPINAVKGKGSCHNGRITIPCNNINKENFCRVSFFAKLYKPCASGYNVYDDISNLDDSGC